VKNRCHPVEPAKSSDDFAVNIGRRRRKCAGESHGVICAPPPADPDEGAKKNNNNKVKSNKITKETRLMTRPMAIGADLISGRRRHDDPPIPSIVFIGH